MSIHESLFAFKSTGSLTLEEVQVSSEPKLFLLTWHHSFWGCLEKMTFKQLELWGWQLPDSEAQGLIFTWVFSSTFLTTVACLLDITLTYTKQNIYELRPWRATAKVKNIMTRALLWNVESNLVLSWAMWEQEQNGHWPHKCFSVWACDWPSDPQPE